MPLKQFLFLRPFSIIFLVDMTEAFRPQVGIEADGIDPTIDTLAARYDGTRIACAGNPNLCNAKTLGGLINSIKFSVPSFGPDIGPTQVGNRDQAIIHSDLSGFGYPQPCIVRGVRRNTLEGVGEMGRRGTARAYRLEVLMPPYG